MAAGYSSANCAETFYNVRSLYMLSRGATGCLTMTSRQTPFSAAINLLALTAVVLPRRVSADMMRQKIKACKSD